MKAEGAKIVSFDGKAISCECFRTCRFFERMDAMPSTAEWYMRHYCQKDNHLCARHMVFKALGREGVPKDLCPNQPERAHKLIGVLSVN